MDPPNNDDDEDGILDPAATEQIRVRERYIPKSSELPLAVTGSIHSTIRTPIPHEGGRGGVGWGLGGHQ